MLRTALLLGLALPVTAQDTITWIVSQLETEIAREHFSLTEDGWTSEVHLDVPGRQVSFAMELAREEAGVRWKLEILPRGANSPVVQAELHDGSVHVLIQPAGRESQVEVDGPRPLIWENIANGCVYELGRMILADEGLEQGAVFSAVLPQAGVTVPFTLKTRERLEERGLWRLAIDFPPGLEMSWTCGDDAIPRRIEVPAQHLLVVTEGAEDPPPPDEGRSVVDSGPWRARLSAPEHEVSVQRDLRVAMRDGVELALDLHRPEAEGRYPTILVRTPYDRRNEGMLNGARFARRGYAVVVQDVRGRFGSDGVFFPLRDETADGSDTIDWIAAQDWSDGQVGMIGGSYVGWVQWYAARSGNPHLKAIVPQVAPPDPDQNIPYEGGVFLLGTGWWSKVMTHMSAGGVGIPDLEWDKVLATLPLGDLDEALESPLPFLDEWLAHPPDDEEYWGPLRYQPHLKEMDVAALHVTGWFDGDQPGSLQNFPRMRAQAPTERARRGQFLVVGPWGHGFNVTRKLGEVDFGPEALIDMQALELRFFDRYLKGVENGIEDTRPVWVFVMGENRWRNEEAWPLPGTRFTPLYLGSDGGATARDGGGRAALAAAGSEPASSLVYDPRDLPEPFADWTDTTGQAATMDLATLEDRLDTLDFTSAPLAGPCELTGPFEAVLWVRSSAADADFAVSVHRITPDGVMRAVAGGIQRVRYRDGTDDPLPPGEVARITVDCWASSVRLEPGDRLRVEVAPSGFPGYARNLGTLEPIASGKRIVVATNTLLHDADHPSHVLLPVVPREDAPGLRFAQDE